jgi:hypothetical protein
MDVLAAYVAAGGSVPDAAELVGIRPSTVKRHLADLRARSGLTTEQLIYAGRAAGWLVVPSLESHLQLDGLAALVESGGVAERVPCASAHGVAVREVADELGSRIARPIAGERRGRDPLGRDVPIDERLVAVGASKAP